MNRLPADDSHVMSSIISSEKYEKHALKMSSASRLTGALRVNQLHKKYRWMKDSVNPQLADTEGLIKFGLN